MDAEAENEELPVKIGPRIAWDDLSVPERELIKAVRLDDVFDGSKYRSKRKASTIKYQVAKQENRQTGKDDEGNPIFVEFVVRDENNQIEFEEREHTQFGVQIRADVFEDLAQGRYGELRRPRIRVKNLWFKESIDLSFCKNLPGLTFTNCNLEGVRLNESVLLNLDFKSSFLGDTGLFAENMSVLGDVYFSNNFVTLSPLDINGSSIGGQLICSGGKFLHEGDNCFTAYNLKVTGTVFLDSGFEAHGSVVIAGSSIGGALQCNGGKFLYEGDNCFTAYNLKVTGTVFLDSGFEAHGSVDINGSSIGGVLQCSGGKFLYEGENSFRAYNLKVTGTVFLNSGFEAYGSVDINGSSIGGGLECSGGKFLHKGDNCFRAYNLKVTGTVFLNSGFEAYGSVDINGSSIGGQLLCRGGKFLHDGDNCFRADNLKVTSHVFLKSGFEAHGSVDINGSSIGGQLLCSGGKFLHKGDNCFRAYNLKVTCDVFLDSGFEAHGSVNITGSSIGGGLACRGGKFHLKSETWPSLVLRWASIATDFLCNDKTQIEGRIDLSNSRIGATATLDGTIGEVVLEDAHLDGTLKIISKDIKCIDLTEATIERLDDQVALRPGSAAQYWWNALKCDLLTKNINRSDSSPKYKLAGVKIKALDPTMLGQKDEKKWLQLSSKDHELGNWIEAADEGQFHSDVYDTFAEVLSRQGRPEMAKYLLIRKHRHRVKKLGWMRRILERFFYDLTVAYGYRPEQVFGALIATWLVCFAFVSANTKVYSPVGTNRAAAIDLQREKWKPEPSTTKTFEVTVPTQNQKQSVAKGMISLPEPSKGFVAVNADLRNESGPGFVPFSPAMYALDHLVPIISFNQKANWDVDRTQANANVLVGGQWFAIVVGWVLTTLFVSSFTGIIKNRQ